MHVKKSLPPSLSGFPGEAEIKYYVKVTVVRPQLFKENHRAVGTSNDAFFKQKLTPFFTSSPTSGFFLLSHPDRRTQGKKPTHVAQNNFPNASLAKGKEASSENPCHQNLSVAILFASVSMLAYQTQQ